MFTGKYQKQIRIWELIKSIYFYIFKWAELHNSYIKVNVTFIILPFHFQDTQIISAVIYNKKVLRGCH